MTNVCHGTTIRDGVEKYLEFHFFFNQIDSTNLRQISKVFPVKGMRLTVTSGCHCNNIV